MRLKIKIWNGYIHKTNIVMDFNPNHIINSTKVLTLLNSILTKLLLNLNNNSVMSKKILKLKIKPKIWPFEGNIMPAKSKDWIKEEMMNDREKIIPKKIIFLLYS